MVGAGIDEHLGLVREVGGAPTQPGAAMQEDRNRRR